MVSRLIFFLASVGVVSSIIPFECSKTFIHSGEDRDLLKTPVTEWCPPDSRVATANEIMDGNTVNCDLCNQGPKLCTTIYYEEPSHTPVGGPHFLYGLLGVQTSTSSSWLRLAESGGKAPDNCGTPAATQNCKIIGNGNGASVYTEVIGGSPPNLRWTVCVRSSGGADSTISLIFVIVLFVGLVIYLVGGIAYGYLREEKRGLDALPHKGFWTDFPFLLKDGAVFLKNKIPPFNKN